MNTSQGTETQRTHVEPEVSLQHGAQVFGHVRHAGVKGGHQARVEGQEIQPAGGQRVSVPRSFDKEYSTPRWCEEVPYNKRLVANHFILLPHGTNTSTS